MESNLKLFCWRFRIVSFFSPEIRVLPPHNLSISLLLHSRYRVVLHTYKHLVPSLSYPPPTMDKEGSFNEPGSQAGANTNSEPQESVIVAGGSQPPRAGGGTASEAPILNAPGISIPSPEHGTPPPLDNNSSSSSIATTTTSCSNNNHNNSLQQQSSGAAAENYTLAPPTLANPPIAATTTSSKQSNEGASVSASLFAPDRSPNLSNHPDDSLETDADNQFDIPSIDAEGEANNKDVKVVFNDHELPAAGNPGTSSNNSNTGETEITSAPAETVEGDLLGLSSLLGAAQPDPLHAEANSDDDSSSESEESIVESEESLIKSNVQRTLEKTTLAAVAPTPSKPAAAASRGMRTPVDTCGGGLDSDSDDDDPTPPGLDERPKSYMARVTYEPPHDVATYEPKTQMVVRCTVKTESTYEEYVQDRYGEDADLTVQPRPRYCFSGPQQEDLKKKIKGYWEERDGGEIPAVTYSLDTTNDAIMVMEYYARGA